MKRPKENIMKRIDFLNRMGGSLPDAVKLRASRIFDVFPNRLLYGKQYRSLLSFLIANQEKDPEQIRNTQFLTLKEILNECFDKSPFYRRHFTENGILPYDINEISDLQKIPPIDKFIVRRNINEISFAEGRLVSDSHTGGTTSSSLQFPETIQARIAERAFQDRFRLWHGLPDHLPKIMFKGYGTSRRWFYNPFHKATVFPFWKISEDLIIYYAKIIQRIKPAVLIGYPSLIFAFAQAVNRGLIPRVDTISTIICSSETLLTHQVKEMQNAFHTIPIDQYGQNEKVCMIVQCPYRSYHIIPEYGITEILDESNRVLTEEGQIGEIVGTGFVNRAFPLIRYKTGDLAVIGPSRPCSCGLKFKRISKIVGRSGDLLVTNNGISFSTPVIEFAVEASSNIKDVQLVQKSIDKVDVFVVPDYGYEMTDGYNFIKTLVEKTSNKIQFNLIMVDKIPRTGNLKKRLIISSVIPHRRLER